MDTKQLKLVDINAIVKYWEANKEYLRNKWAKKIFVGTQEEYYAYGEQTLEEGALVIILDAAPEGYSNFIAFNEDFYTVDDELFFVKEEIN